MKGKPDAVIIMQAIRLQQVIEKDSEINLTVFQGQEVEVIVLFSPPPQPKKTLTARQLLNSGLIGLWEAHTDITDSVTYAHQLRKQAQARRDDYSSSNILIDLLQKYNHI